MKSEIWINFTDKHQVSSIGRVRSTNYNNTGLCRILSTQTDKNGYAKITIRGKYYSVARLVCTCFNGVPKDGEECDHINGVKTDNRAENLRWVSHSDNCSNPITSRKHGDTSGTAVIVDGVEFCSMQRAAEAIGVSSGLISNIIYGRRKNHTGRNICIKKIPQ